jgi:hypothetical protein
MKIEDNDSSDSYMTSENDTELQLDSDEYLIDTILDQRSKNGITEYLIKWDGYPIQDATWEPESNLTHSQNSLVKFKRSLKNSTNHSPNTKMTCSATKQDPPNIVVPPKQNTLQNCMQVPPSNDDQSNHASEYSVKSSSSAECIGNIHSHNPKKVKQVRVGDNDNLMCIIEWCPMESGVQPTESIVSYDVIESTMPYLLTKYLKSILLEES